MKMLGQRGEHSLAVVGLGTGSMGGGYGGRRRMEPPKPLTDAEKRAQRATIAFVLAAPPALAITQTDSNVTFTLDANTSSVFPSDGRIVVQAPDSGIEVDVVARWQGNAFMVTRRVVGGGKVTESFIRWPNGTRLIQIVNYDGGPDHAFTFRRVYARADAQWRITATAASPCRSRAPRARPPACR